MNSTTRSSIPDARERPGKQDTALKLWVILSRAHAAIARHAEADIERHELTGAEFGVLEALYHVGPLLLGEVQRHTLVSSGGVTYLVDRLEKRGLVKRANCPTDRRARYAMLTPAGEAFVKSIFPDHERAITHAMSGLTKAERSTAIELLRKLGHAAAALPPVQQVE